MRTILAHLTNASVAIVSYVAGMSLVLIAGVWFLSALTNPASSGLTALTGALASSRTDLSRIAQWRLEKAEALAVAQAPEAPWTFVSAAAVRSPQSVPAETERARALRRIRDAKSQLTSSNAALRPAPKPAASKQPEPEQPAPAARQYATPFTPDNSW